jgi:hypothetical protein
LIVFDESVLQVRDIWKESDDEKGCMQALLLQLLVVQGVEETSCWQITLQSLMDASYRNKTHNGEKRINWSYSCCYSCNYLQHVTVDCPLEIQSHFGHLIIKWFCERSSQGFPVFPRVSL